MPRVIQEGELQIRRRSSMTKEVVQFSRTQKMQLEYTFLWFLAKVALEKDTHYGYKGQWIYRKGLYRCFTHQSITVRAAPCDLFVHLQADTMYNLMIYCILKIFFLQLKSDNKALYSKWTTFKCNVKQISTFSICVVL